MGSTGPFHTETRNAAAVATTIMMATALMTQSSALYLPMTRIKTHTAKQHHCDQLL